MDKICVLRLGHRIFRDSRLSTHVLLVARAFGAEKAYYTGDKDTNLEKRICKINIEWGGDFVLEYIKSEKNFILNWQNNGGDVIHLTMYGLSVKDTIENIKTSKKPKLLIVGGAKVSGDIFSKADWNISITNQPHSEVSALSIFLHEYFSGKELDLVFSNPKVKIIPQKNTKKLVTKK